MVWDITWSPTADKQLEKITKSNKNTAQQIVAKLEEITDNPYIHTDKLHGSDLRKLRIGDYRVILNLEKEKIIIFIVEVGHRSKIYKKY
jgi:mRNA interferase RelE/StbE